VFYFREGLGVLLPQGGLLVTNKVGGGGGGGGREAKSTLGIRHSDVFILHLAKREVIAIFFCLYNALITVLKHFYFLKLCSQKNYS